MFIYLRKKAQSTAEYVIILGLVVGAVVAMQTYIKRGLQRRMKLATDFTDDSYARTDCGEVVNFSGDQYEPYYLSSQFNSTRSSDSWEALKNEGAVERKLGNEFYNRTGHQTIAGKRHTENLND